MPKANPQLINVLFSVEKVPMTGYFERKAATTINDNLAMILQISHNGFDEMRISREIFTIGDLVIEIKGREEKPTLLIDYLKEGNKKMIKRVLSYHPGCLYILSLIKKSMIPV